MKKKLLTIMLVLTMMASLATMIVGCANGGNEHTHTYATEWTTDDTYHWHIATCEHISEISEKAEHTYGEDNRCTVCQNEKPADESHSNDNTTGEDASLNVLSMVSSATFFEGALVTSIEKYDAVGRISAIEMCAAGSWNEGVSFEFQYTENELSQITVYDDFLPNDRSADFVASMHKDGKKYVSGTVYDGENAAYRTNAITVEAELQGNGVLKAIAVYRNSQQICNFEYDEEGRLVRSVFDGFVCELSLSDDKKSGMINCVEDGEIVASAAVKLDGASVKSVSSDEYDVGIEHSAFEGGSTVTVSTSTKTEGDAYTVTSIYSHNENKLLEQLNVTMQDGDDRESYTMKYQYNDERSITEFSAVMYDGQGNEVSVLDGGVLAYTYGYNNAGQLVSIDMGTTQYTYVYGDNGDLIQEICVAKSNESRGVILYKSITSYFQNDELARTTNDWIGYDDGIFSERTVRETEFNLCLRETKYTVTQYDRDGAILDTWTETYE